MRRQQQRQVARAASALLRGRRRVRVRRTGSSGVRSSWISSRGWVARVVGERRTRAGRARRQKCGGAATGCRAEDADQEMQRSCGCERQPGLDGDGDGDGDGDVAGRRPSSRSRPRAGAPGRPVVSSGEPRSGRSLESRSRIGRHGTHDLGREAVGHAQRLECHRCGRRRRGETTRSAGAALARRVLARDRPSRHGRRRASNDAGQVRVAWRHRGPGVAGRASRRGVNERIDVVDSHGRGEYALQRQRERQQPGQCESSHPGHPKSLRDPARGADPAAATCGRVNTHWTCRRALLESAPCARASSRTDSAAGSPFGR